ncbi:MAG: hypothetical protein R3B70_07355 [Polyangiaceae bacterium]
MAGTREREGELGEADDERDEADDEDESEDEGDEDDEVGEDEEEGEGTVTVERLRDVGEWEMYRLIDEDDIEPLCVIALKAEDKSRAVEYAIWREKEGKDTEEPGSTGSVVWDEAAGSWSDEAREDALRQIAYRYEEDIGVGEDRLEFRLVGPPLGWDDEDGDDETGDEDEAE